MPGVRAKQLCPHGIFVAPRMDVYAAVSAQVRAVFERFTDLVEPLSLDEAFLDVTGSTALFGDGASIAARLKNEVRAATQLTVSVGVATSKYVAKVASDLQKPDGLVVVAPGDERAFLAPLPVARLFGVGPVTQRRLAAAGLQRIGDVQAKSIDQLVQAFGKNLGEHLFVLANGLDARTVEPDRDAKSIGHEMTFAEDLQSADAIFATLLQLAQMVARRLRKAERRCTVVRLKLRYPDFTTLSRQRKLEATSDDLVLYDAARSLARTAWDQRRGVRLLGVTAGNLVADERTARAGPVQGSLFDGPRPAHAEAARGSAAPAKRERLLRALDSIKDRHGEDALRHGIDSRRSGPFGPGT
jgi:DNA polymerase-4